MNSGTPSHNSGFTPKIHPSLRNRTTINIENLSNKPVMEPKDIIPGKDATEETGEITYVSDTDKPDTVETADVADYGQTVPDETIIENTSRNEQPPVLRHTSALPEPERDIAPDNIDIIVEQTHIQSAQYLDQSPLLSHMTKIENTMVFKHIAVDIPVDQGDQNPNGTDGQRTESLYLSLGQDKLNPIWSPDGETITFNDKYYGIWNISSEGGIPELVFDNYLLVKYHGYFIHPGGLEVLGYDADRQSLIFKRFIIDEDRGSRVIINDFHTPYNATIINPIPIIELLDIETGNRTRLTNEASTCDVSATGKYLAWITQIVNEAPKLMIKAVSTGEEWTIVADNPSIVKFRAGTNTIVYQDSSGIYGCEIHDGDPELISDNTAYRLFDVSPDGEWLLLGSVDNSLLAALHIESGELFDIMPNGLIAINNGSFSPDGSLLCVNAKTSRHPESTWEMHLIQLSLESLATDESEKGIPQPFSIRGPFPNPFNASTRIDYTTETDGPVRMDIYNVLGQKVAAIVDEPLQAGAHSTVWDGRDENGRHLSSGVYIAQISSPDGMKTLRMTLMK